MRVMRLHSGLTSPLIFEKPCCFSLQAATNKNYITLIFCAAADEARQMRDLQQHAPNPIVGGKRVALVIDGHTDEMLMTPSCNQQCLHSDTMYKFLAGSLIIWLTTEDINVNHNV